MQIYIPSKIISKYLCKISVKSINRNCRKCIYSKVTQVSLCTEIRLSKVNTYFKLRLQWIRSRNELVLDSNA